MRLLHVYEVDGGSVCLPAVAYVLCNTYSCCSSVVPSVFLANRLTGS